VFVENSRMTGIVGDINIGADGRSDRYSR